MRFGHFFYPMNSDASRDSEAIEECLLAAELVKQLRIRRNIDCGAPLHWGGGIRRLVGIRSRRRVQDQTGDYRSWDHQDGAAQPGATGHTNSLSGQPESGPLDSGHGAWVQLQRLRVCWVWHHRGRGTKAASCTWSTVSRVVYLSWSRPSNSLSSLIWSMGHKSPTREHSETCCKANGQKFAALAARTDGRRVVPLVQ